MRVPSYRKHSSGQARVTIQGRDYLLGNYGSNESKEAYRRLVAEYIASGGSPVFGEKSSRLTMSQVALAFLEHAKTYYQRGREFIQYKAAVKPVSELYSDALASKFGPAEYKACRTWWLSDPNRSRQYVNKQAKRLVAIVKWAVSEGLIPPANYQSIKCVEPLRYGRSTAPESTPVEPIDDVTIARTIVHCTPVLADMIRFELLVGCRPGELVTITPAMVDRSNPVWEIKLAEHKTAWRGKLRTIYVGPKAQAILSKYLLRGENDKCFSPIESERQRRAAIHEARKTPLSCGNRPGTNRIRKPRKEPGESFSAGTYARAIRNACNRGKIKPWAPNRLRHSAATKIRRQYGIEAASTILGHSDLNVTLVYAEQDRSKAIAVAKEVG